MKRFPVYLFLVVLSSIIFSCSKDKSIGNLFTRADSISSAIDSVKGNYRVLVTKRSLTLGHRIIDTLGVDTIEVTRKDSNSITILNYDLAICDDLNLILHWFYFSGSNENYDPPTNQEVSFFLVNDSIEFKDGYWIPEWEDYICYQGTRIPL